MNHSAAVPPPDGDRRAVVMPGHAAPAIITARLRLSPVVGDDLEELFALHSDPRAFAEDTTAPLTQLTQMRQVLALWRSAWEQDGRGYLTVRARAVDGPDPGRAAARADGGSAAALGSWTGAGAGDEAGVGAGAGAAALPQGLLGVVGITALHAEGDELLSAYWRLHPAVTGRGMACEAMRAVLAEPHCGPGGREVVAVTAGRNRASIALAESLGFLPAPAARPVPGGRAGDVLLVRPAS